MKYFISSLSQLFVDFGIIWQALSYVWFIVFPPMLYWFFKIVWLDHVRKKFKLSAQWVVLELIPPRNIERSPSPMESFFVGFAGVTKSLTAIEEYLKGELISYMSLEIVSTEGSVHFFVRTKKNLRNLVEANLYAQYPDIEILEVPDYTENMPKLIPNKDWTLWGCDFGLIKPDPYPIKTYKFFEEKITGEMVDPLLSAIEVMTKLGPGEHLWFQILAVPQSEKWMYEGLEVVKELAGRTKEREKLGQKVKNDFIDVISRIPTTMMGNVPEFETKEEKKDMAPLEFRLTPGEKDVLKAVESNLGKYVFLSKVRFVYLAKKEAFKKPLGVSAFIGAFKQFADFNLNSFKPEENSKTYANYIFKQARMTKKQRKIYRRFKDRDNDGVNVILSTEELATIFHMPDKSVLTPSVSRVVAKTGGAPSNLPI